MIVRYVLHIEWVRGWWPWVSLRRVPDAGAVVWEGMTPHRLECCTACVDGFIARPLPPAGPSS